MGSSLAIMFVPSRCVRAFLVVCTGSSDSKKSVIFLPRFFFVLYCIQKKMEHPNELNFTASNGTLAQTSVVPNQYVTVSHPTIHPTDKRRTNLHDRAWLKRVEISKRMFPVLKHSRGARMISIVLSANSMEAVSSSHPLTQSKSYNTNALLS